MIEADKMTPAEREELTRQIERETEEKAEFPDPVFAFVYAAVIALDGVPNGTEKDFTCPLCGMTARGIKSNYNGHIHASCGCGMRVIE